MIARFLNWLLSKDTTEQVELRELQAIRYAASVRGLRPVDMSRNGRWQRFMQ